MFSYESHALYPCSILLCNLIVAFLFLLITLHNVPTLTPICKYAYIHCRLRSDCKRKHVIYFSFWDWVTSILYTLLKILWFCSSLELKTPCFIYVPDFHYLFTWWWTIRQVTFPCNMVNMAAVSKLRGWKFFCIY